MARKKSRKDGFPLHSKNFLRNPPRTRFREEREEERKKDEGRTKERH
jgi:hypothetical protein